MTSHARSLASSDGRQDCHAVAVVEHGVQRTGEADVLVVDVDVDEAVQAAVVGDQPALQAGEPAVQVVDERGQGVTLRLDGLLAAGVGTQDGRDLDLDGHGGTAPLWTGGRTRAGQRQS
jgi:uncharacterized protein YccT (UPF0319 family)